MNLPADILVSRRLVSMGVRYQLQWITVTSNQSASLPPTGPLHCRMYHTVFHWHYRTHFYCSPEYFWTVWLSLTLSTCHFVIMFWKLLFHFRFFSLWFYLKILCKTLVSTGYFRTYRNNYLHRKQRWSLYLVKKKACCNKVIHILRFQ